MKIKFLGVALLALFAITGTSCSAKKGCGGGGWYGNRNLSFETTKKDVKTITKKDTEYIISTEDCAVANP